MTFEATQPVTQNHPTRQPKALPILVFAEMWERFGFYIIQALLILYLTQALGLSDSESYAITGAFTAFVYISPIIGGYIADQILGFKNSIILGGVLFTLGYAMLALWGENLLYIALAVVIIGNGFFKPNISSLLGAIYQKNDPRREAGFTFFYMGINLGSMLATLSSGFIKDAFGWWAGFGTASVGLLLAILNFILGAKHLAAYGKAPVRSKNEALWQKLLHNPLTVILGILVGIPMLSSLLRYKTLANVLLFSAAAVLLVALIIMAYQQPLREQRNKMFVLIWLTLVSVLFWAVFFQIFFSLNLFVDRRIDRVIWGTEIPTVAFISFESLFIVLLAPFLAKLWSYLNIKGKNPSVIVKFLGAFLFMAIAFLLLYASTGFHQANLIHPLWIPIAYLCITLGEMLLSPIGLSAVTVLAPERFVGLMMGVWLIAIGYGGKLAGVLASLSSIPEGITDPLLESQFYGNAFFTYSMISLVLAVVTLLSVPLVKRFLK